VDNPEVSTSGLDSDGDPVLVTLSGSNLGPESEALSNPSG